MQQYILKIPDAVAPDVANALVNRHWSQALETAVIAWGRDRATMEALPLAEKALWVLRWWMAVETQRWLEKAAVEAVSVPLDETTED